jgi:acetyltransferase-like isoleucine patch superfamily enzyme
LRIGNYVYIGKQVHIEADCEIGNFVLIANRVAIVGRYDHDFRVVGFPVRFAPWIGSDRFVSSRKKDAVVIEDDVWIGYGAIILTGVKVGRGAIVGAGSLVTKDIEPYTIAIGVPAHFVGKRFSSNKQIEIHEKMIKTGQFRLSERGYDACLIEPGSAIPQRDRNQE